MPRSRRRQSKRRSAAERSPIKHASASSRHLQQPASATDSSVTNTATSLELDGSMADRYYAMQRGGIVASGPTIELSQDVVEKFLSV